MRAQLKKLRDDLLTQSQQSRTFGDAPPEMVRRLSNVAARVSEVYLQSTSPMSQKSSALEEAFDEALVEGHLALNEWSEWVGQRQTRKTGAMVALPSPERRVHAREQTILSIKLLQHNIRDDGMVLVVDDESVDCPTRDVSSGGAFVMAGREVLPGAEIGYLLHVTLPGGVEHRARAIVVRRDDAGMALRWITETPQDRAAAQVIVSAIRSRWLATSR